MPRISAAHIYCAALIKECRVAIDIQWILDDASLARHCAEWRKLPYVALAVSYTHLTLPTSDLV